MRTLEVDYILSRMLAAAKNTSDLNISVGRPFQVESAGELTAVDMGFGSGNLTPFQTENLALALIGQDRRLTETLLSQGSCDLSYEIPGLARFRVNIFSRRGAYSIVLRKIETKIPTCDDLRLPEAFRKMAEERNGIILVTGATGSGKSTSLAALLNEINNLKAVHIITLEDPVEFVHSHKKSTFNQREMSIDFSSFAGGLRAALRQAPKVILVGEMRDRETVEIALSAAETGHLVLSTLHTINAGQTINRILGMFNTEEEQQVRVRLADTLRWVACQRLLPKIGGGRIAAFEIMRYNLRIKDSILNGESEGKTFYEIIQASRALSMVTFDDYIVELFQKGEITEEAAKSYASNRSVVNRGLDLIKSAAGQATTDIGKLEVDTSYGQTKEQWPPNRRPR